MFKNLIGYFCLVWCIANSTFVSAAIREYHLTIDEKTINITGKSVKKISVNGQFPAPTLSFEEGDDAVITVHNALKKEDTSLHWHGLLLPGIMDGVPGLNGFQGIKPGAQFTYRFKVRQNGTYWYHAHSKGQEQDGLYGAFIIYPKGKQSLAKHEMTQQDYVVMLSDFHLSSGQQIMNNLKKDAEYYQNQRETIADVWQQIQQSGFKETWQDRKMWNQMRMLKSDLSDVTGYTFLVNGQTAKQNWTGLFNHHDKVRLRFINASAMSFFDVRIPNLKMTVISADGQPVQPIDVDEFRIGTAETYDVIVQPTQQQYQIQAESIDRSGFALATLLQNGVLAQSVASPQHRPRALLTMDDMPMAHDMHQGHVKENTKQKNDVVHGEHHASHDSSHQHMMMSDSSMTGSSHEHHHMMVSSQIATNMTHKQQPKTVQGWANAATPDANKALSYADLKALQPQSDLREPSQDIEIRLGGTMERYIWTINGKKYNEAEPLQLKYGERVRLKFINESMMAHPMHLHGMFVQLENGQNAQFLPNKHTIVVPPNKTISVLLTADELGEWAIHCHLLYHMTAGMMTKLVVADVADKAQLQLQQHMSMPTQGAQHEHH